VTPNIHTDGGVDRGSQINMLSALVHVVSDTLRSTTTLIEGILIKYFAYNSVVTDAYSAIFVFSLIAVSMIFFIIKWWSAFQTFWSTNPLIDQTPLTGSEAELVQVGDKSPPNIMVGICYGGGHSNKDVDRLEEFIDPPERVSAIDQRNVVKKS